MNLKHIYWVFPNAVSPVICDKIIDIFHSQKKGLGTTGLGRKAPKKSLTKKDKMMRDSYVTWSSQWWLYRYTHPYIHEANEAADWKFQWSSSEACQLTEYRKGQYYHWHRDSWDDPYKSDDKIKAYRNKCRKLSSVLVLSDQGKDYTGGDLEFFHMQRFLKPKHWRTVGAPQMRKRGALIVFPSFVWHRVTPVHKGVRYSLTNWHIGDKFV